MQGRKGKRGEWERKRKKVREEKKRSKDEKSNKEGRKLCGFLGELGWSILNGNVKNDEEGKWTYTGGKGGSVINYVLGNNKTKEDKENESREKDRLRSPMTIWVEREQRRKGD